MWFVVDRWGLLEQVSAGDRDTKATAAPSSGPWSKVEKCVDGAAVQVWKGGKRDTQRHHQVSLQIQLVSQQK